MDLREKLASLCINLLVIFSNSGLMLFSRLNDSFSLFMLSLSDKINFFIVIDDSEFIWLLLSLQCVLRGISSLLFQRICNWTWKEYISNDNTFNLNSLIFKLMELNDKNYNAVHVIDHFSCVFFSFDCISLQMSLCSGWTKLDDKLPRTLTLSLIDESSCSLSWLMLVL